MLSRKLNTQSQLTEVFEKYESNVRYYCKSFPVVFDRAKSSTLYSELNREFIDFFSGAGTLNYGHNNPLMKKEISEYLTRDGISHGLDMYSSAKKTFLSKFSSIILEAKGLDYKVQFSGPTGTNAIEAALKLARNVKAREGVFSFMGGFHGASLGSLSVTGNRKFRAAAGLPLTNVTFIPYEDSPQGSFDSITYTDKILKDTSSGIELPAAIILETVQAEGGVYVTSVEWLQRLRALCDEHDILLICDDIQVGCGRTGSFFSFERANIVPDIVTLSKSISGYGLPMSIVLMKRELDIWKPGEHNGTFRGNQLAFVSASAALNYWKDKHLENTVREKESFMGSFLQSEIAERFKGIAIRGIGMIWGIDMLRTGRSDLANKVAKLCFDRGLVIETCGREDSVLKLLPALTIDMELLNKGCDIIREAILELS
ncbi:diaminobutyrate--2-oxoglutarate transaminase [Halotia wernerae UHCC 0503]|nr:diaminobutyrate--2-oxoglutarate transaminase [Halotia wernerae UHCC 0503]